MCIVFSLLYLHHCNCLISDIVVSERFSMASCVWTHLQQPGCRRWVTINTYRDSRVRASRDVITYSRDFGGWFWISFLDICILACVSVNTLTGMIRIVTHEHACVERVSLFSSIGAKCFFLLLRIYIYIYIYLVIVRATRKNDESLKIPLMDIWDTIPLFRYTPFIPPKKEFYIYESDYETNCVMV